MNLIGEHVDYNGGRCLPIALRQATTARVSLRDDALLEFTSGELSWQGSIADLAPGRVTGWAAYVAGVLWALEVRQGLRIELSSDVPIGAGLSSSAALECSVAVAVDAALGLGRPSDVLLHASLRAESEFVGAPTGGLDQTASIHAQQGQALLIDFTTGAHEQVPFDLAAQGLSLLVVDTRVSHSHADGGYGDRRAECEQAAEMLGVTVLSELAPDAELGRLPRTLAARARHVVSENARVDTFVAALRADEWALLGPLMDASHTSLRDDFEVSCEELDVAVEAARAAGALGARMTGGGFGGSAIALVSTELVEQVRDAVAAAFAERGWGAPDFLLAEAGPGARLVTESSVGPSLTS